MKKFTFGKAPRKVRVIDYLRQLSIVVLGIVITFVGGDLINRYSKQREVAVVMHLVKIELENNKQLLKKTKEDIDNQNKIGKILIDKRFKIDDIPLDTLKKYRRSLVLIGPYDCSKTSLDVLKSSALMQHIADKAFLLSLIQTYESMEQLSASIKMYYNLKSKATTTFISELNDEESRNLMEIRSFYRIFLSSQTIRTYLITSQDFFGNEVFDELTTQLDESIAAIDKMAN